MKGKRPRRKRFGNRIIVENSVERFYNAQVKTAKWVERNEAHLATEKFFDGTKVYDGKMRSRSRRISVEKATKYKNQRRDGGD